MASVLFGSIAVGRGRGAGNFNEGTRGADIEAAFPSSNVTSRTHLRRGDAGTRLAGRTILTRSGYSVAYDLRGFPILDSFAKFDTRLSNDISKIRSSTAHYKAATEQLKLAIKRGEVPRSQFRPAQLRDIESGGARIRGYSWHHHQDVGRMQLVPRDLHNEVGHVGGSLWYR